MMYKKILILCLINFLFDNFTSANIEIKARTAILQ